jgi:hypothetical protein
MSIVPSKEEPEGTYPGSETGCREEYEIAGL